MGQVHKGNIILGVSGSIACYKALEILRLLIQRGFNVQVIMTNSATQFVSPLSFEVLSQNQVITETTQSTHGHQIKHIALSKADLFLIAPATANTISKLAHGIADNVLLSSVLATRAPIYLAPAMNTNMYEHPLNMANIQHLQDLRYKNQNYEYQILAPIVGELACGTTGEGKMQEPETIVEAIELRLFKPKDFINKKVIVSAGPTQVPLDPVRLFTNRSSGRMGYAIARAAQLRGAKVVLISGPTALKVPLGIEFIPILTNDELKVTLEKYYPNADFLIQTAAICDYEVPYSTQKIKKTCQDLQITLKPTLDILALLGKNKNTQCLVGFAAESENLLTNAQIKLRQKNLDFIVVNDISNNDIGFDSEDNMGYVLSNSNECVKIDKMNKLDFAHRLLNIINLKK